MKNTANLKSRRTAAKRKNSKKRSSRGATEFGAFFRLCQFALAAVLLYVTASLFAVGVGSLGEGMASAILRTAGGGIVLILLHFFYGLLCSLLNRQVSSVASQWMGTIALYLSLSLFLGLLGRLDMSRNIGLLSSGLVGSVMARVLTNFIGAVGTILAGLCLVFLSAFNYGHLSSSRVAWVRTQCAKLHLPMWMRPKERRAAGFDSFDPIEAEENSEENSEENEKDQEDEATVAVALEQKPQPQRISDSYKNSAFREEPSEDEVFYEDDSDDSNDSDDFYDSYGEDLPARQKRRPKRSGGITSLFKAVFAVLNGDVPQRELKRELSQDFDEEPMETDSADSSQVYDDEELYRTGQNGSDAYADELLPVDDADYDDYGDYAEDKASPSNASDVGDEETFNRETFYEEAPDKEPLDKKVLDERSFEARQPTVRQRVEPQTEAPAQAAAQKISADAPVTNSPTVEADQNDALHGTEGVEYYGGRAIPAGSFPPPLDLLGPHREIHEVIDDQKARENGQAVIESLANFGVSAELKRTIIGPTVVQYQIQLAPGIKVRKVSALGNDIAVALGVSSIRVEAPIPGTSYVGIELPNPSRRSVPLRQIIESDVFQNTKLKLPLPLGQTVDGRILISGLEELPHLLIAGTTGSGKSIFVNNCIVAMCYHNTPAELRFIMVDPKRVEMGIYESLPHILAKPIVSANSAVHALAWAVREMDRRYELCSQLKVRNLQSYNEKVLPKDKMPHIVIIVDELADLMMTAQKEVEECIMRLAQMARAVGIHLMLATQRPSVNVLTGTIKANIPARVSFSLPSIADSRTILDASGAQNLLGKGDMLFLSTKHPHPLRIQSPFMDEQMNIAVVEYLRNTFGDPEYVNLDEPDNEKDGSSGNDFLEDSRLEEAIKIVLGTGVASSSGLQRQMRVGFTRAARMIDTMEALGIVGPQNGAKPREILVDESEALEILDERRGQ